MWSILRKLFTANPMGIFVYSILTKWYIIVAVGGIVVMYWVFKGLESAGVLEAIQNILEKAVTDAKSVAKNCVPKITNLQNFIDCLDNIPKYNPEQTEIQLQNNIDAIIHDNVGLFPENINDPYSNDAK